MKKEDFEKAKPIMDIIENIEDIIKDFDFGWDDGEEHFIENSSDFCSSNFFNVVNYKGHHSTNGGSSDVGRIMICKYKDNSGPHYVLDKQEIIDIQNFILDMLEKKKEYLINTLDKI